MERESKRIGCKIIDFGLGYTNPELTYDEQVKCLSWLIRQLPSIYAIPPNSVMKVIPAEFLGGPYPAIGLWAEGRGYEIVFSIEELLAELVEKMSVKKLLDLSATETLIWEEVLNTDSYWPVEKCSSDYKGEDDSRVHPGSFF